MLIKNLLNLDNLSENKTSISPYYFKDEITLQKELVDYIGLDTEEVATETKQIELIIEKIRERSQKNTTIDSFLQEYSLTTKEGVVLMCLAEALLRIPDKETVDQFIKDRLLMAKWSEHLGRSDSFLVNASTWGLVVSNKLIHLAQDEKKDLTTTFKRMLDHMGEPVIRSAIYQAMKIMGQNFVLGETIESALKEASKNNLKGYDHSFDMLGEAAISDADAAIYFESYRLAISKIGEQIKKTGEQFLPTISIKLSALHPRYEEKNRNNVLVELYDSVLKLAVYARDLNVGVTIDAEEMDRLELSLDLFEKLFLSDELKDWGNLGLAVQAYSKRALPVLCWLNQLAISQQTKIPIRLVKGAYWDSEIKLCQQRGIRDYPVYTKKVHTDVSYLACAHYLIVASSDLIYGQFATHNVHTSVSILNLAIKYDRLNNIEFQRLHGMGKELYDELIAKNDGLKCRVYAPVGSYKDLLPYLVRRLLENGANSSFVYQLLDAEVAPSELSKNPVYGIEKSATNLMKRAGGLFSDRKNSEGTNLDIQVERDSFFEQLTKYDQENWQARSLIHNFKPNDKEIEYTTVSSPYQRQQKVGSISLLTDENLVDQAIVEAEKGFLKWRNTSVSSRAKILNQIADLYEENKYELIALCAREAGRTILDGIDEVREAVDFCRYYARRAEENWGDEIFLDGPTGEENQLHVSGRGVFVCISPWNFPLAIFTGQIVAALVTGNAVIAKPAEQTNLVAFKAISLMHQAGIPKDVIQLVCGSGRVIGNVLVGDERIAGVCFTGSTQTARHINKQLADRESGIIPLIAETGGQNAMIVDSTALLEQVVKDAVFSAFSSAGQRCSALRVLYVQKEVYAKTVELLKGYMDVMKVGEPLDLDTDIASVIDDSAQKSLLEHIESCQEKGFSIYQKELTDQQKQAFFVPPTLIEIDRISFLTKENFGPILHVIAYDSKKIEEVVRDINATGFALTFGLHSRNESFCQKLAHQIYAGNVYINRNQIGAVVGVNPFGGNRLSGTGPKAGGPYYLYRFIEEKTVTNNITAIGGNTTLLTGG